MKIKSFLATFVVLVILIVGFLLIYKKTKVGKIQVPAPSPSVQQKIEDRFKGLVIPADTERAELKDVSGGVGMGIATRSEILADLPDPTNGQYYQVFLEKEGKTVLLGKLEKAKGGWILSYNSVKFPGYNKVIITMGATHILEGSF